MFEIWIVVLFFQKVFEKESFEKGGLPSLLTNFLSFMKQAGGGGMQLIWWVSRRHKGIAITGQPAQQYVFSIFTALAVPQLRERSAPVRRNQLNKPKNSQKRTHSIKKV